jgi:hypothetical protein
MTHVVTGVKVFIPFFVNKKAASTLLVPLLPVSGALENWYSRRMKLVFK